MDHSMSFTFFEETKGRDKGTVLLIHPDFSHKNSPYVDSEIQEPSLRFPETQELSLCFTPSVKVTQKSASYHTVATRASSLH